MTRRLNKDIELYYFEQFRSHYPLDGWEPAYGDKPDVILHGDTQIGVEIANLYLADGHDPTSEQSQRQFRRKVLREAQARYLANGGKSIELSVTFDAMHPIHDSASLVASLATAADRIDKLPAGSVRKSFFSGIPEVLSIFHNPTEYDDAIWRAVQVYSVPNLSLSRVATIVQEKNRKLLNYAVCDTYWLLLVVDFADFAQDQEIEWPPHEAAISSKFEKIIIYKPQFAAWTEVPIRNEG